MAYLDGCTAWRTRHGARWELPSLEALEAVALGPLSQAPRWPP